MSVRRRSGRTSRGLLASGGSWAYGRSRIALIAPALALVLRGWNNVPAGLVAATVAILALPALVAVLLQVMATLVALFSNDDLRAERALQVLDGLLRHEAEEHRDRSHAMPATRRRRQPSRPARDVPPGDPDRRIRG